MFLVRMISCLLTETIEYTIFQFKSIFYRLISHHKIFVRIILMKLYKLNSAFILLTHHRISKTFSCKCLTNSRRTLKNNIFLILQNRYQHIISIFRHIYFIKKIFFCICICFFIRSYRILFTNHIIDEFIFSLC